MGLLDWLKKREREVLSGVIDADHKSSRRAHESHIVRDEECSLPEKPAQSKCNTPGAKPQQPGRGRGWER